MTQQGAIAGPVSATGGSTRGGGQGQSAQPWWHVAWSLPAALRGVRAAVVIPCLFALTFKVIANEQMTIFAVFGGFAALVLTSFGGSRLDKAVAHLGLAVAGSLMIVIATLVTGSTWLAVVVTVPVAFAVFFAGSAGPNAAAGVTGCLLAYVLPVASAGSAAVLPSRLEGWWLAQAVSTLAVLALSPRPPGHRLRALAAALAGALAHELDAAIHGTATHEDREASVQAANKLRNAWIATPYRPVGLADSDQALSSVIHLLDWCTSLISEVLDGHVDVHDAAVQERDLLTESVDALNQAAALLDGRSAAPDVEQLWRARRASARHVHEFDGEPSAAGVVTDQAFHAQIIGVAAIAVIGQAMIVAGQASADEVAADLRRRVTGNEADGTPVRSGWLNRLRPVVRSAAIVAGDASLRSVWFRNSARGAIALAAAVAVAKLIDVQHAFWVVLGTLSVLRTSAAATGVTAWRALLGTTVGFAIGAVLMLAIGTNPTVLWVVYPVAVLVAAYTPGTAPFAAGQAAFTIALIVLFNILVPAGWRVGLLRVEDVSIGCAVSLVVGVLFWPRGTSSILGDNLADAFRSGAGYLSGAVQWALGQRGERPELALDAVTAGVRLDDAMRGYLTEQGSKRISKADLWTMAMATTRLRLIANSLASLPGEALPTKRSDSQRKVHALLSKEAGQLSTFYDGVAAEVAKPGHAEQSPPAVPSFGELSEQQTTDGAPGFSPEALWVSHHLAHLNSHSAQVAGPAERMARLRRTSWWRAPSRPTARPVTTPADVTGRA
jgi:Fusaric acid resistance protein-like